MSEDNFKIEKKVGTTYEPVPDDKYVVEFFTVKSEKRATYDTRFLPADQQELEPVLDFQFAILNGENRTRCLWANFVPAYFYISKKNGKNALYRILEALYGKEITPEQEASLDLDMIRTLIGKQISVFTEVKIKGDKKYNNIIKFMPCTEQSAPLTAEEKEKCTVKVKIKEEPQPDNSEIRIEDVPF